MTEAGTVPDKAQLLRADLGAVTATAVEDGLLVEYPARRQGHLVGSRILQIINQQTLCEAFFRENTYTNLAQIDSDFCAVCLKSKDAHLAMDQTSQG